jgi:hypothetical protein
MLKNNNNLLTVNHVVLILPLTLNHSLLFFKRFYPGRVPSSGKGPINALVSCDILKAKCKTLGLNMALYETHILGSYKTAAFLRDNHANINPNDIYYLLFLNLDDTLKHLTEITNYTELHILQIMLTASDLVNNGLRFAEHEELMMLDHELTLDKLATFSTFSDRQQILDRYLMYSLFTYRWYSIRHNLLMIPPRR